MSRDSATPRLETVELTSEDAASGFSSGKEPLDTFFRTHATQNQKRGINRTWVLRRSEEQPILPPVLGIYSLTLCSIERAQFPADSVKKLPRYPVPIVLIGRLARDVRVRGQRIGERLLRDAHLRSLLVSDQAGAVAVVVDAKDAEAEAFYKKGPPSQRFRHSSSPEPIVPNARKPEFKSNPTCRGNAVARKRETFFALTRNHQEAKAFGGTTKFRINKATRRDGMADGKVKNNVVKVSNTYTLKDPEVEIAPGDRYPIDRTSDLTGICKLYGYESYVSGSVFVSPQYDMRTFAVIGADGKLGSMIQREGIEPYQFIAEITCQKK